MAGVLAALEERRNLHRHVFHAQTGSLEYYTPEAEPLQRQELYRRFALLAFTSLLPMRRPLLGEVAFRDSVESVARTAGLPALPWRPCYVHRANASEPPRLSLIRVGTTRSMQAAIDELERFVASPAFRPWWYFAEIGSFVLTYLHRGPRASADELGRWLRRRPLLSRLGEKPAPIPVFVYEARTPAEFVTRNGPTKKDNTPAGVLSRSHRPESA
ncbi:MAG: hypothetical protein AMXMBFR58_27380 [Phycisphaerae bacterium]